MVLRSPRAHRRQFTRRVLLTLALAGLLTSSTGLGLALHQRDCQRRPQAHHPLDCLVGYAVHGAFSAPLEAPPAPLDPGDAPRDTGPVLADHPTPVATMTPVLPRAPPHAPLQSRTGDGGGAA